MLLALVALALLPAAASAACKGADTRGDGGSAATTSKAILCLVNEQRTSRGLKALKPAGQLKRGAVRHSRDMVAKGYFSHVSPAGTTILSRTKRTGYLRKARSFLVRENLEWARGDDSTPRNVVKAWMASSVHRGNILLPALRDAGIGIAQGAPSGGAGATVTMLLGFRKR